MIMMEYNPNSLGFFRSFKVCSDAKERVKVRKATGSYLTYSSLVKLILVPEFTVENLPLGRTAVYSERPALGQNTPMMYE